MSVYPFWGAVAAHTGRLLRLQGTAAAAHVQRRVREQYGERETAARAARRVLRSFIGASLRTRVNGSATVEDLLESPSIFPFRLAHISAEQVTSFSHHLDILRHGLDDELVMLSEEYT